MHYYQHHIGDFIKATARLSDGQAMAYLRLIWMYYDKEKPLKPDTKLLAFQIGASEEDTSLILESFFVLCENGWHNTRCDKEIAEYHAMLDKRSSAGRASAERRKNKSTTDVEQVLNTISTDEQLTNNHKPITNKPIKDKTAYAVVCPQGVDEQVWNDWLAIRKAKRLPLTATAWNQLEEEAMKAGLTMDTVIKECCLRGWGAFKASWWESEIAKGAVKKTQGERNEDIFNALTGNVFKGGSDVKLLGN